MDSLKAELRQLLRTRDVVPFIGAGVSSAVANAPGWWLVLKNGLEYVEERSLASVEELASARSLLNAGDYGATADSLKNMLGAPEGEWPAWLRKTFGFRVSDIKSREVLDRVFDLLCPLVVTTNYDRLISLCFPSSWSTATWDQPVSLLSRMREEEAILYLHGTYDLPQTVVLGGADYRRLRKRRAYRDVVSALWLQKNLLFIGCSESGLSDPDFSRFFEWAAVYFKGRPFKHYWLTRTGEVLPRQKARRLLGDRLQIVEYGASHEDLPRFLAELCPDREQAIHTRIKLVQNALGSGDPDAVIAGVVSLREAAVSSVAASSQRTIFGPWAERTARLRRQFADLQGLAQDIVSAQILNGPFDDKELVRVSGLASAAVYLFPEEILGAIVRRGVYLHATVWTGFAKGIIEFVTRFPQSVDSYDRENMFRVIKGLRKILAADPHAVFVDIKPATATTSFTEALLVARSSALQLVSTLKQGIVLAELPLTPRSQSGVTAVGSPGSRKLVGHSTESIFVWNPFLPNGVERELYFPHRGGITAAVHTQLRHSIVSLLGTVGGKIFRSVDFGPPEETGLSISGLSSEVVITDEGRIVAILNSEIVELIGGTNIRSAVTKDQLNGAVRRHPGCHVQGEFLLTHTSLKISKIRGVEMISISAYILQGFKRKGTAILFFEPRSKPWELVGTAVVDSGDTLDYFLDAPLWSNARLWLCLMYRRNQSHQNLVLWCDGVETRNGLVFRQGGSFGQHTDDLTAIVAFDEDRGFVSDASGGLLSFSKRAGELIEIQKEPSKICSLEVCLGSDLAPS